LPFDVRGASPLVRTFVGSGERLEDLELFHPDRIVSRMLGLGDVLSLIEKAEQAIDQDEAEQLEEKLRKNQFTLGDFRKQLRTIRKMGPLESILGMLPGMGQMKELANAKPDEKQLGRVEAIVLSMTPTERAQPEIISGSPGLTRSFSWTLTCTPLGSKYSRDSPDSDCTLILRMPFWMMRSTSPCKRC